MYVIEVIPLGRGASMGSLSYFSSIAYKPGSIIAVPLRTGEAHAVVTGAKEVSTAKTALRAATFSLRKLPPQEDTQVLSTAFLKTATELAQQYACSENMVLYALMAPEVRSGDIPLPHTPPAEPGPPHIPELLTGTTDERYLTYRSLVRETFAHNGSVLFAVPTSVEAAEAYDRLSAGITERVVCLSSALTKKELREQYAKLDDLTRSKLVIATPSHAIIERHDITTMVLEHERSPHFRERTRPYLDYRDVLTVFARHTGRRLIMGDLLPRSEEEDARRAERFQTLGEAPKRMQLPGVIELIHMKDEPNAKAPFKLFSDKVLEAIETTQKEKGRVFLFTARRGLAPVVACFDCGYIFRSKDSNAPLSLIRTRENGDERRWFVCPVTGHREPAADTCPICGSWRLRERGIGIQHVHDELSKLMPRTPLILFDHTSANTFKKASFLRDKFYKTKGAIMLGTQMAIPYLTKPVSMSTIVNMDALLATPTWRQHEDTLATLLALREHTTGTVFVQTRVGPADVIDLAKQGAVEKFYDEELELRKTFNYPPYTRFIHLTWQGNAATAAELTKTVKETLKGFSVSYYTAPPSPKGSHIHYGLLRIAQVDWPSEVLVSRLRALPPSVRVVIDPDRIV